MESILSVYLGVKMIDMIQVVVFYSIKANADTQFAQLFSTVRENVLSEPGCIQYELFVSPYNPLRFCLVEKWATQASLDAHLATKQLADFRIKSSEFFADKSIVEVKTIASERII